MTSEEILIKISNLKDEVESKIKEIESLNKQLKKNAEREARRMMRERRRRANKMADFIRHNSSRTIIAEISWPEFDGEEYLGEMTKHHILKKGEYDYYRDSNNNWCLVKEGEFSALLECVDNIYVAFE